ncbi:membrane hypothetical protein [Mesorhizobium plurifarium]|uniref:ABC transmembrane type-1 domain-containing protein n=1 Tax=Mesorhizobium plurifarium TaxID=69974 RepID=A0A090DRG9_MESPL|nr:membrane hypothetical protein [Mesorhizobium plurifarium]
MTTVMVAALTSDEECRGVNQRPGANHDWRNAFAPLGIAAVGTAGVLLSSRLWPESGAMPPVLGKWTPLLLKGFAVDLAILSASMVLGTFLGLILGLALLSRSRLVRWPVLPLVQLLRNSPGLVFLFFVAFALPFKFTFFGLVVPFPGWSKVIFSFALKISASVAEILCGAVQSIGKGQWEAAAALGLSRGQTLKLIIVPQCLPRMLPPWMNIVAIFLAAVPMASLVGVYDAVTYAGLAIKAEQRADLIIPVYAYATAWFFAIGYLLHQITIAAEKRGR